MSRKGYPSDKQDQFMLRLPDGMRDRIKAAAEENNRSMNAEIVATLTEKYPDPGYLTHEELMSLIDNFKPSMTDEQASAMIDKLNADLANRPLEGRYKITLLEYIRGKTNSLKFESTLWDERQDHDSWLSQADGYGDAGYGGDGTGDGHGDGDGAYGDSDGNGDGMGGRS